MTGVTEQPLSAYIMQERVNRVRAITLRRWGLAVQKLEARIEVLEAERLDNGSLIVQCEDMKARILRLRERLSRHECTECGLETGHAAGCSSALAKGER